MIAQARERAHPRNASKDAVGVLVAEMAANDGNKQYSFQSEQAACPASRKTAEASQVV